MSQPNVSIETFNWDSAVVFRESRGSVLQLCPGSGITSTAITILGLSLHVITCCAVLYPKPRKLLCHAAHIHTKGCHQHPLQAIQTSQSAKRSLDKSKQLEWDRNSTVSGWEPQWIADRMALLGEAGQLSIVLLRNDNVTCRRCIILVCCAVFHTVQCKPAGSTSHCLGGYRAVLPAKAKKSPDRITDTLTTLGFIPIAS